MQEIKKDLYGTIPKADLKAKLGESKRVDFEGKTPGGLTRLNNKKVFGRNQTVSTDPGKVDDVDDAGGKGSNQEAPVPQDFSPKSDPDVEPE